MTSGKPPSIKKKISRPRNRHRRGPETAPGESDAPVLCPGCGQPALPLPDVTGLRQCSVCGLLAVVPSARKISLVRRTAAGLDPGPVAELTREFRETYRLEALIGGGGMGVVFRALQHATRRPVAVKFLREMDSRCDRERFMREARVLSRIRHPHIIQLFDAGLLDRAPYLVLELMEGDNLRSLLSRQAPLAVDRALSIAISCLEALETCHGAGIIHRDLKPDNILLSDGGEPRITDFGLVTDPGSPSNLTAPGEVVGTPAYLSPETIQGGAATAASDLYSMGLVLFEMLTARHPFLKDLDASILLDHLWTSPPSIRATCPQVPERLDTLVRQCLAKDPRDRPGSAGALALALATVPAFPAGEVHARTAVLGTRRDPGGKAREHHGRPVVEDRSRPRQRRVRTIAAGIVAGLIGLAVLSTRERPAPTRTGETSKITSGSGSREPARPALPGQGARLGSGALVEPGARALALSPDGRLLASSGDARRRISIWDTSTGQVRGRLGSFLHPAASLAFDRSGRTLGVLTDRGAILRYRLDSTGAGAGAGEVIRPGEDGRSIPGNNPRLAFDARGRIVVAWKTPGHVEGFAEAVPGGAWSVPAPASPVEDFPQIDPDGYRVGTMDSDGTLLFRGIPGGKLCDPAGFKFPGAMRWAWLPRSGRLAVLSMGSPGLSQPTEEVSVIDLASRGVLWRSRDRFNRQVPTRHLVAGDSGRIVAISERDGLEGRSYVSGWDTLRDRSIPLPSVVTEIRSPAFSEGAAWFALGFTGRRILIVDDRRPTLPPGSLPGVGAESRIEALAFTPDGRGVFVASLDGILRLWKGNGATWRLAGSSPDLRAVDLSVSPDGRWLALRSPSGFIGIAPLGRPPLRPSWGSERIAAMAFLPGSVSGGPVLLALTADGRRSLYRPGSPLRPDRILLAGREERPYPRVPSLRWKVPPGLEGDEVPEPDGRTPLAVTQKSQAGGRPPRLDPPGRICCPTPEETVAWIQTDLAPGPGTGTGSGPGAVIRWAGPGRPATALDLPAGFSPAALACRGPAVTVLGLWNPPGPPPRIQDLSSGAERGPGATPIDLARLTRWWRSSIPSHVICVETEAGPAATWIARPLPALPLEVTALALSPDGSLVAAGGRSGEVAWFDRRDALRWHVLGSLDAAVCQLSFDSTARRLAAGAEDGSAMCWGPLRP